MPQKHGRCLQSKAGSLSCQVVLPLPPLWQGVMGSLYSLCIGKCLGLVTVDKSK